MSKRSRVDEIVDRRRSKVGKKKPAPRTRVTGPRHAPAVTQNIRTGGFLGMEYKFFDMGYSGPLTAPALSAWTGCEHGTSLNTPVQGSGPSDRNGNLVHARAITIEGCLSAADTTNALPHPRYVFIALVLDTQCNGTALNSEDVYTSPYVGSAQGNIIPFRNLEDRGRFRILAVKRLQLNGSTAVDTGPKGTYNKAHFRFHRKLNYPINFKANTGAISDVGNNNLAVVAVADVISIGAITLTYNSRFRFTG